MQLLQRTPILVIVKFVDRNIFFAHQREVLINTSASFEQIWSQGKVNEGNLEKQV